MDVNAAQKVFEAVGVKNCALIFPFKHSSQVASKPSTHLLKRVVTELVNFFIPSELNCVVCGSMTEYRTVDREPSDAIAQSATDLYKVSW